MAPIRRRKSAANKNLPVFSHEFIIQNHGDIVSTVVFFILLGLTQQVTLPVSSIFMTLHYGQATDDNQNFLHRYGTGFLDIFTIFFYSLICIIFHAIIQEYVLDKICCKLHLSKSKNSKFNESGQLIIFIAISIIWPLAIFDKENVLDNTLSFSTKLFYITQLAYWAHNIPELYFQKIKKEDMFSIVKYSVLYLTFISAIYINFHRIGVIVLCLHYITEFIKHVIKLLIITGKEEKSQKVHLVQNVYNWLFFIVQSLTLILSQTMLWYGLKGVEYSGELCDFHTLLFKLLSSVSALAVQSWIVYEFFNEQKINFHNILASLTLFKSKPFGLDLASLARKDNENKKRKNAATQKLYELTEAYQNAKKTLKKEEGKTIKST